MLDDLYENIGGDTNLMYYRILSIPISSHISSDYKGVYRSEPFPLQNSNREFLALWQKYVNYIEPSTHIWKEMLG